MIDLNKTYELTLEDVHTDSLEKLYDNMARAVGFRNVDNLCYDCRKIEVSKAIFNEFRAAATENGAEEMAISMIWCCSGPKATIDDSERFLFKVQPGFITQKVIVGDYTETELKENPVC